MFIVEAAFWRRRRAGVSAFIHVLVYKRQENSPVNPIYSPPEPESSFLDGLEVRDWEVPG